MTWPVVASQRLTLPFAPVEASRFPSGLNTTFRTPNGHAHAPRSIRPALRS